MKNNTYKKGGGYFPEYHSFAPPMMANGGGLLSRKVTCSNCGHSWKGVTGGTDPLTCHNCGGMIKMSYGGDPSIPDLHSGDWLMKYKDGGPGIGEFFRNLFGGKGGRGSVACPTGFCGKFNDGTGGGGLHLGQFFSNVGNDIGEGAQAVGNFLGDFGSGIGGIFGTIGDGHRRRRKCFEKGMEWNPVTKKCESIKVNNPSPDYGGWGGGSSISYTPQPVDTTTTMIPGYGMVGPQQDNGIVWNYNPALKAQDVQNPINPSPNIGGDLYETNKSFAMYGGPFKRFDGGGVTCGKGQVRFADEKGERCIDITSQEYKDIYAKGIGSFQKFDKAQNKWVATTQDDPDARFVTNKATLPAVTVESKVNPAKRAEYLKKEQEKFIGPMGPNYNASESTRNQPMVDLNNKNIRQQEIINAWKTNNPKMAGLSDAEIQNRIDIQNSSIDNQGSIRGLTSQESEQLKINSDNEAWRHKYFGSFAGGTEGEKTDRWHKENEEHDAEVAEANSAILAKDNGQPFTLPTGKTKLWKDMDWREKSYVRGLAQSRGLKVFPGATSNEPFKTAVDELNPFPILNDWVKGFATSPYAARETDSYMPYVSAVANPAITVAAIMAGQPELTAGKALTGNILNWKKPFQNIGKAMIAAEEGDLIGYGLNKLKKDTYKGAGSDINRSLKSNLGTTPTAVQLAQLENTPSNQGINSAGLFNSPSLLSGFNISSAGPSFLPLPGLKKYGGSAKRMKNWTDKYK